MSKTEKNGEPPMLKNMMYWLSFGITPRREQHKSRHPYAGHTLEDERSFTRRMAFYKAHPHH